MLVIGLTGNIGSGKSSVARLLSNMGAQVIDTDQIARDVVAPGTPGFKEITAQFGASVLNPDGTLNRSQMAQIVFNDPTALKHLNAIVHPKIKLEVIKAIDNYRKNNPAPLLVIEAPLLIETGMHQLVSEVWLVTIDSKTQLNRIINRDQVTKEQVQQRLAAQMPQEDKLPYANKIITNNGTPDETLQQVQQIWSDYIESPQTQV